MDRVAVVTGGSRGVGLSVVRTLLEAGWRVHAHYRTQPADIIHDRLMWWQADFTQGIPTAQASGFPQLPRIDALIHCAGVATLGSCASLERDEWERHMAVNLHSPVQLTRQLLPQLRANHAHVVYINSGAGKRANPQWGAYAASKFAARAWCDALRQEEPEITVTSIFPGRIATDMQKAIVEYEGNSYNPKNFIAATTVAHSVLHSLSVGSDAIIPEIVIRPRM
ncbi:SDR family oxidoreductase [Corynebacterium diphtheriae]|uniref:SDR family oxidoreductase n=1 Tax=Corynebacterium diphtheriae TaxID=1717 RepID=UPI0015F42025|nr:SDR family oxidoreductase [Corynebacterium diphtheriae]MBG9343500.1 SDR family oxidoreductase [Corynebacterium diphtheriae]